MTCGIEPGPPVQGEPHGARPKPLGPGVKFFNQKLFLLHASFKSQESMYLDHESEGFQRLVDVPLCFCCVDLDKMESEYWTNSHCKHRTLG